MMLRFKLLIILLTGIIITGGTLALFQHFTIYPRFIALEQQEATKDLLRCERALRTELGHLHALTHDWSSWDDTYEFIQQKPLSYIDSNLALETFVDAELNAIYFFDAQGNIFWGKCIELKKNQPLSIQPLETKKLAKGNPLYIDIGTTFPTSGDISKTGLLNTEFGPMMVAVLPILTTENKGPALGTMIMGRIITPDMKRRLREQTQVPFDIKLIENTFKLTDPESDTKISITEMGKSTLVAGMLVPDITGKSGFLLETRLPRNILAQGYAAMAMARNAIILTGLMLLGLLLWLMAATIVKPITRLTGHVLVTRETGNFVGKCYGGRKDEIGILEQEFDRLLETVAAQSRELERELGIRKRIAEELKENLKKYRLLAENLKDVVAAITPDGFIQYCSPAIVEFSGHDPEDIFGKHSFQFIPENDDRLKLIDMVEEIAKVGDSRSFEFMMRSKSGDTFPVESTARPVMEDGKLVSLHCVFRDITQRKKAEEEKNRLQAKLQRARRMEALGTLAGGIAHNFNNVLFPIMGNTELAMMDLTKDSQAYQNLTQVLQAVDKAKNLVRQILSFSDHGKEDANLIVLKDVVEDFLVLIRASLPSTIDIRNDLSGKGGLVSADPVELQRVIMNICSNAAYAMRESGGILELTLVEQDITEFDMNTSRKIKPGKYAKLTISDNGPGIENDVLERIFDPYFSTKPVGEGSGMGLAETHALISKYGGDIKAYTEPGMGTSFSIFLPIMMETKDLPWAKSPGDG